MSHRCAQIVQSVFPGGSTSIPSHFNTLTYTIPPAISTPPPPSKNVACRAGTTTLCRSQLYLPVRDHEFGYTYCREGNSVDEEMNKWLHSH
jgi:hypothetical protein